MHANGVEKVTGAYSRAAKPVLKILRLSRGECVALLGGSEMTLCRPCACGVIPQLMPGHLTGKVLINGRDSATMSVKDIAVNVEGDVVLAMENTGVPQVEMEDGTHIRYFGSARLSACPDRCWRRRNLQQTLSG